MSLQVANRMSKPPLAIRDDADYRTAFDIMRKRHVHHVPVVNPKGVVVGMLAERDLLLAATHYQNAPVEAQDVMHSPVVTAFKRTPLVKAARTMLAKKIGGLPVVDAERRLLGMITETDVLREFVDLLGKGGANLRNKLARQTVKRKAR